MAEERPGELMEADLWAGPMGERWLAHLDQFESMILGVGEDLIARAQFRPGERVIDIGCGGGATSLAIARMVAPTGSVTGLDISPALVRAATERAEKAAVSNLRFVQGDAAAARLPEGGFDRLFSRFGVMFFGDPHGAFAHLHGVLRPGGGLDFVCWGPVEENPWMGEIRGVFARHLPPPAEPPQPRAPGPFAFAEPDYVREILGSAGFKDVEITPWRGEQELGGRGADPKTAARFVLEALPFGDALKELGEDVRRRAREDLEAALARRSHGRGVRIGAMAWFVTATA